MQFPFAPSLVISLVITFSAALSAQPASDPNAAQREAMQKLNFLAGHWSGPITIFRAPGETLHYTQTEEIEFKAGGLVLLIEGTARDAEGLQGKEMFSALATVAFDEATHTYRFRAYNGGHYLDTELIVLPDGFSWSYDAGPAHIVNTMHLIQKGEWAETTDATVGGNPPHRSVDMLLQHRP